MWCHLLRMWKVLIGQLRPLSRYCHRCRIFPKILILESRLVSISNQQSRPSNLLILPQHCNHSMTLPASMIIKTLFFSPTRICQQIRTYSLYHQTLILSPLMKRSSATSLSFHISTTLHRVCSFISLRSDQIVLTHASSTTIVKPVPSTMSIGKSKRLLLPPSLYHPYISHTVPSYGTINTPRGLDSRSSNATLALSSSSTLLRSSTASTGKRLDRTAKSSFFLFTKSNHGLAKSYERS
jgi:hypothetical protein